jgi:FkbM family methyltransferase
LSETHTGLLRQSRRRIGDIAQIYSTFSWIDATRTMMGRACTFVARKQSIAPKSLAFWLQIIGSKSEARTAPEEWNIRPYMVRTTGCFIDVGGSVGLHSRHISELGIEVFAFEPDPRAFRILQRVAPKAHVYPYAVGDEDREKVTFALFGDRSHSRLAVVPTDQDSGSHTDVRMVRLDSLEFPKVAVIKIDNEGWELPVLEGAIRLLERDTPRTIIEIHRPFEEQREQVMRLMREMGYTRIRQIWKPFRDQYHLVFFEPELNGSPIPP